MMLNRWLYWRLKLLSFSFVLGIYMGYLKYFIIYKVWKEYPIWVFQITSMNYEIAHVCMEFSLIVKWSVLYILFRTSHSNLSVINGVLRDRSILKKVPFAIFRWVGDVLLRKIKFLFKIICSNILLLYQWYWNPILCNERWSYQLLCNA